MTQPDSSPDLAEEEKGQRVKNRLPGENKGYIRCNWQGSYPLEGVFNRCDCIPPLGLFMLLWYSIATGRGPIRKKGFLIDATASHL